MAEAEPEVETYWPGVQVVQEEQEPALDCVLYVPDEQDEQPRLFDDVPEVETYWPALQVLQELQEEAPPVL